jgi:hypothetical protein
VDFILYSAEFILDNSKNWPFGFLESMVSKSPAGFSRHEIGDIWDFLSCALFLSQPVLWFSLSWQVWLLQKVWQQFSLGFSS